MSTMVAFLFINIVQTPLRTFGFIKWSWSHNRMSTTCRQIGWCKNRRIT